MTQMIRRWAMLRGIRPQCVSSSFCARAPHGRSGGDRSEVQNAGQALRQGVLSNIFRKAFGRIKIKHAPLGSNPRLRGNGRCALPTELDLSQECHGRIRMLRHGMMQLQKHSSNFLGGGFRASGSIRKSVTDAGYSSVGRASDCRSLQQSDGPWFDSGWPDFAWVLCQG